MIVPKISTLIEKLEEIHCNAPNGGVPVELREVLDEPEVVVRRHPHDPRGGAYIAVVLA